MPCLNNESALKNVEKKAMMEKNYRVTHVTVNESRGTRCRVDTPDGTDSIAGDGKASVSSAGDEEAMSFANPWLAGS